MTCQKEIIQKLTAAERRRLDRLRAKTHGRIRRALNAFLSQARSDDVLKQVINLLENNNVEGVLRLVDSHIIVLANFVPDSFIDAGREEANHLRGLVKKVLPDESLVGVAFDPSHPRAAALMQQNKLEFVTRYTRKQREVTRQVLVDALRDGKNPRQAAEGFKDSIGLTNKLETASNRYRQLLEERNPDALIRDLRDRRFDGTVRRAIETGENLSKDQINKMVARYRKRALDYRSEAIARTETTTVLSMARHESAEQVNAQAGIPDSWIRRTWGTNLDGRERQTHGKMNGQVVVGMNSVFVSPSGARLRYPGDPLVVAEERIHCRCDVSISYEPQ